MEFQQKKKVSQKRKVSEAGLDDAHSDDHGNNSDGEDDAHDSDTSDTVCKFDSCDIYWHIILFVFLLFTSVRRMPIFIV